MPWDADLDSQILAVHGAVTPGGGQGQVVLFGGDEHWSAQQEPGGDFRNTVIYDVETGELVPGTVESPDTDVFCSGHAFTGDGRLLIVGGTKAWSTGHGHDLAFWGHRRCWLFNPRERGWVETTQLLPDPAGDGTTGGGRWYPGAVTTANGDVIGLFGHVAQDDSRHRNVQPERYNPSSRAWSLLPKLANDGPNYEPEFGNLDVRFLFYARTFQLPDGTLFFATPMPVEWAANTTSGDDPTDGTHFSSRYDPGTGQYVGHKIPAPAGYHEWYHPCVLLPLLPEEGYRPRVLHCGHSTAQRIDLGPDVAQPAWQPVATALEVERANSCAVLLPTGRVCLIGGVENASADSNQVLAPEIYDPGIDWGTGTFDPGLGSWTVDETDLPANSRNYHSMAVLLPTGGVLTAGGNRNADPGDPNTVGIKKIEVYQPAYPAGTRPTVSGSPDSVTYGETFTVTVSDPGAVDRVAFIRSGSCTHAFDFDQRYVGLQFTHEAGDPHITVTAPPDGNVAPPGYYMLWVVDEAGRPCELAPFVRLAHQRCSVVTDRSTFSREEVSALGNGGQATFQNAVYVYFDGFIHTELGGPPSFSLVWDDTNEPVLSDDLTLVAGPRLQEVNPGNPDIPQRITFPFHVRFENLDAFDGFSDSRQVRVTFRLGHHSCSQLLDLTYAPNPYMIDIDIAENNPPWLSTDVRVFSTQAGGSKFGVPQGSDDPIPFIRGCLDELNDPANDGDALFESLSTSATLDLATTTGWPLNQPVFNYAIARVRYRAQTTEAERVKCFFRVFNVAATGLHFDPSTTYARTPAGPGTVPLVGIVGGEVASIPFFATERVETVAGNPGADSMASQPLTEPYDVQDIAPNPSGAEVTAYFGCWLDINQTRPRMPLEPGNAEGPWPASACLSLQELMRGLHLCIVAEIFFEPDLTTFGETPDSSDNLAQRNLAVLHSDNPGGPASRTVLHTFEIKPSDLPALPDGEIPEQVAAAKLARTRYGLDELLFRWHNLPADARVTVFFSDVDTGSVLRLGAFRASSVACQPVDKRTLLFPSGGATWMPIPGGRETNIPALLSVELPDSVVAGDEYKITVHQVAGRTARIIGSCEFRIEVSKAEIILPKETRDYSVMKHIASRVPAGNRWYPIMQRYVHQLGLRVDALGGDSATVHGNPDGSGRPFDPGMEDERPDGPGVPKDGFRGLVRQVLYDCDGRFVGFVLRDCGRSHRFRACSPDIEELVLRACHDRLRLTVFGSSGAIDRIVVDCC